MIDRLDIYLIAGTFLLCAAGFGAVLLLMKRTPSIADLEALASIFNTKGGIIMFLWFAWWMTLVMLIAFGVWVIVRGVDPQHAVVITVLGTLNGGAFFTVNGALLKTMTGEEPRPPAGTSTTVQQTTTATVAVPTKPDTANGGGEVFPAPAAGTQP